MSFRSKVLFFTLIGLLVVAGLVLALVFRPKNVSVDREAGSVANVNAPSSAPGAGTSAASAVKPLTQAELTAAQKETAVKNQAKLFVERFGSYSPGADFANFDELKTIVTPSVAQWLEEYKKQLLAKQAPNFSGVTTRVVSQKIISLEDKKASVLASAQQEEILGQTPNVSYQDMLVKLVWRNDEWLVDGAFWQ